MKDTIVSSETADEYKERLASYTADKDPLEMQRDTLRTLSELLDGFSDDILLRRPPSGKWSVSCILAHLAEDELVTSWRYRQMIEHCGSTLPGFDQDLWSRLGAYDSWRPREAFEMFRLLREANLRMLGILTTDQWQSHGIHVERGQITVEQLAHHMAGHDENHLNQIRLLLKMEEFDPRPRVAGAASE